MLIAVVMVDVATAAIACFTDFCFKRWLFMSRDLFWTVNFSTGSLSHSLSLSFPFPFLVLVFGRWSCCVCFAVFCSLFLFAVRSFTVIVFVAVECFAISTFHWRDSTSFSPQFFFYFFSFHPLYTKFSFCSLTFPVFISFRIVSFCHQRIKIRGKNYLILFFTYLIWWKTSK